MCVSWSARQQLPAYPPVHSTAADRFWILIEGAPAGLLLLFGWMGGWMCTLLLVGVVGGWSSGLC